MYRLIHAYSKFLTCKLPSAHPKRAKFPSGDVSVTKHALGMLSNDAIVSNVS